MDKFLLNECVLLDLSHRYSKGEGKIYGYLHIQTELKHNWTMHVWKNSALDFQGYNTFHQTGSDHRPIIAKERLALRANQINKTRKNPDASLVTIILEHHIAFRLVADFKPFRMWTMNKNQASSTKIWSKPDKKNKVDEIPAEVWKGKCLDVQLMNE